MFEGFRPETIDFLWGIRLNNRKDWFEANKQAYLEYLYAPMKELGTAVFAPLQEVPGLSLHVSRIYRDARYAHGLPYKDSLWLSIRHDGDYWAQLPCLYFDLHPEYFGYGFGVIWPRADSMERFRQGLAERPDEFLELAEQIRKDTGFSINGETYRRKKPCPDPRLEPYFNLKQIFCLTEKPIGPELFSPELAGVVAGTLQSLMPLYRYCQIFTGSKA